MQLYEDESYESAYTTVPEIKEEEMLNVGISLIESQVRKNEAANKLVGMEKRNTAKIITPVVPCQGGEAITMSRCVGPLVHF